MMRISIMISTQYPTITMIIEMTIHYPTTSVFGDHPRMQWASAHQKIPSRQHLENESRQLNQLLPRRNPHVLQVKRSIFSRRRRMNVSLHRWHPSRYPIMRLNDSIRQLMYIFTRGRIQTKPVSNWLYRNLEICGDMSPLLTT